MTKEELKKEAENFVYGIGYDTYESDGHSDFAVRDILVKFAEPREKRIAELEEAKANLEYLLEGRDNEIDEVKKENKVLAQNLEDTEICKNGWKNRVKELEAQIEKMKEYVKLLQDICTVMGNDPYMVSVGLENRVKVLWDSSEEKEGLKMVEDIENRLLKIKPQDWAEIEKWKIKEK